MVTQTLQNGAALQVYLLTVVGQVNFHKFGVMYKFNQTQFLENIQANHGAQDAARKVRSSGGFPGETLGAFFQTVVLGVGGEVFPQGHKFLAAGQSLCQLEAIYGQTIGGLLIHLRPQALLPYIM